jgi:uncharacterized membrane protein
MASPASIAGHPLHPMLIPFPIALWTFSFVADVIYLWRDNPTSAWRSIAYYTLLAGCIGAVAAAVPGIVDYFSIKDRKVSNIAAWHARINILALLIFAASFYLRTGSGSRMVSGSWTIPAVLSLIGVLLIGVSGWLGGELVYKHGVSVEPQHDTFGEERDKARVS